MRWKLFIEFCLTFMVIFVLAGDIFLPQPYRSKSQTLKANINYFLVDVFPALEATEMDSILRRDR